MTEQYTYAVARIRALEVSLFSNATIEQLIACQDYNHCLQFLAEKGWGDKDTAMDENAMLTKEEEKIWKTVGELSVPMEKFEVLSYPKLFHNLKAAIKAVYGGVKNNDVFYNDVSITGDKMLEIVKEKQFYKLPANMQNLAPEIMETLLHTGDGQMCDVMVDKAALDAIYAAGMQAKEDIIRDYAESTVALADIKIAVRAQKTGKSLEFMKKAMAECKTINVDRLAKAALSGIDSIKEYLAGTAYAEAVQALDESPSAFERWCDNRIIKTISPQKYKAFTLGPVIAYVIARQNEIKTVRIILSGKLNNMPESSIRERVRDMYV